MKGKFKGMMKYQPFEFPFKKSPRTLSLSGQTNRTLLYQKIISLFAQTGKAPQRSISQDVDVYRPIRFDRATAKALQNQWGGEKRPSKKSLIAKLNPNFLESLKNVPAKLDAKNEIMSAHSQAQQDTIPFSASNFPSLKAA